MKHFGDPVLHAGVWYPKTEPGTRSEAYERRKEFGEIRERAGMKRPKGPDATTPRGHRRHAGA